jgi:hypothetical protein
MRRSRLAGFVMPLLVLVTAGGCSEVTSLFPGGTIVSPQGGDPIPLNATNGQVVMTGTVMDSTGRPASGAYVFLVMQPTSDEMGAMKVGDTLHETPITAVTTAPDGSFSISLGRDDRIASSAATNGGYVNFMVYAWATMPVGSATGMGMWGVPLKMTAAGYEELPGPFTITLSG